MVTVDPGTLNLCPVVIILHSWHLLSLHGLLPLSVEWLLVGSLDDVMSDLRLGGCLRAIMGGVS